MTSAHTGPSSPSGIDEHGQEEPDLRGNPLAEPSGLPHGLPDFAALRTEHFLPAFRAGVAAQKVLLEQVATSTAPPSFASVVLPLEDGDPLLRRVSRVFFHLVATDGTPEMQAVEAEVTPWLTALSDAVFLDPRLFARVDALHGDETARAALSAEERHLLERLHQRFVLRGARLDPEQKETLAALNQEISRLETRFTQQARADLKGASVHLTDEAQLAGLDAGQRSAAREAAIDAGLEGWLLTLVLPTVQRLLPSLEDRSVRERLYRASAERGTETWDLAAQIAEQRSRKAALLGFADFASLAVADRTAAVPEAVEELFAATVGPAMRNVEGEAARIAARAARDGVEDLAPWDWAFYEARVRTEEHAVDEAALQPYLVLERVIEDGVLRAAGEVYGLAFTRRDDLTGPHPQALVWEVRREDGEEVGLFIGDYFTRDAKRGGAWMNVLSVRSRAEGTRPIVMNTLNISRPAPGEPAFVTLDEVRTLFHEFGHALHALLSDVEHASASGTAVPRDVVEFPSQVNEMWALRPGIVEHYARHVDTGEPVPAEQLERVRSAALWGEGFATAEYLAAAVLDWRWHRLPGDTRVEDPRAFEAEQLEQAGLSHPLVAPRYRTGYFQHTFSGGYAAGYYSYLWAEVFDADSVAWFEEQLAAGRPVREVGEEFARAILAIGGSADLLAAYRGLRGRDREVTPLLERRGLV